jgi:Ca2+-binding RTX toxin-like protein
MATASDPIPLHGVSTILPGEPDPNPFVHIEGTEYDNALVGTEQSDMIDGLGGNDILLGMGEHDYLVGGDGNDNLTGGLGDMQDDFSFDRDDDNDVITDFNPGCRDCGTDNLGRDKIGLRDASVDDLEKIVGSVTAAPGAIPFCTTAAPQSP